MSETTTWRHTRLHPLQPSTAGSRCSSTGRRLARIRGDRAHPALAGLHVREGAAPRPLPERPRPADVAAAARGRTAPSRRSTGTPRSARSPQRLGARPRRHGGETIFYYGGGGQGNHLGGAYARATRARARIDLHVERARAGEDGRVLGRRPALRPPALPHHAATSSTPRSRCSSARTRGSRTASRAPRVVLKAIATDPGARADRHRSAPHRDRRARRLSTSRSARAPTRSAWRAARACSCRRTSSITSSSRAHATDGEPLFAALRDGPDRRLLRARPASPRRSCARPRAASRARRASRSSRISASSRRRTARSTRTSRSSSTCSPATSAEPGGDEHPHPHGRASAAAASGGADDARSAATASSPGSSPATSIPDEILTDHPERFRAMIVESANPAHSLADSPRMREALAALELVVVIDVAMTETARLADYVLPAAVAVREVGGHVLQPRVPAQRLPAARARCSSRCRARCPSRRSTAGSCARSARSSDDDLAPLRARRARRARAAFADAFFGHRRAPRAPPARAGLLYETLGPTLPERRGGGRAALGRRARLRAWRYPDSVRRAGFDGEGRELGEALFERDPPAPLGRHLHRRRVRRDVARLDTPDGRINLAIPELLDELARSAPRRRPRPTPSSPSCCPRASAARRPRTRSSAIRPGAKGRARRPAHASRRRRASASAPGAGRA